jgi:hypothetical protein
LNVAILCGYLNSSYARDVLRALNAFGLERIDVVAAVGGNEPPTLRARWAAHGWGLPSVAARSLTNRFVQWIGTSWNHTSAPPPTLESEVKAQGGRFVVVQEVNGGDCRRALHTLRVDLLILAGTPIIRAPILEVPHLGTLNAHQGALPRFRGMNVIEWAVLEGHPPAITVHFVDAGVDTGDIIAIEPVPIQPGDTLQAVRTRASAQQVDLLARTASAALAGPLPRRPQCAGGGRQYFTMHPRLRAVAEQCLREHIAVLAKG